MSPVKIFKRSRRLLKPVENVENEGRIPKDEVRAVTQMQEGPHPEPVKLGAKPIFSRQSCRRQSFTTREVAEKFITDMHKQGSWQVVRCAECGMLHIDEKP